MNGYINFLLQDLEVLEYGFFDLDLNASACCVWGDIVKERNGYIPLLLFNNEISPPLGRWVTMTTYILWVFMDDDHDPSKARAVLHF